MECGWCGRKRGFLEHFTKFGFCHRCDALVRGEVKESLYLLSSVADRCSGRLLRHRVGGGAEHGDAMLLREIDEALGIIVDLEELRTFAPFFKTSLDDMHTRILLCRAVLPGAPALPEPKPPAALLPGETVQGAQQRAEFSALLASLEVFVCEAQLYKKLPPRRLASGAGTLTCAQVAARSDTTRLGDYIALDVKTTGASPRRHEVVGISAVRFEAFEPKAVFSTLLIPRCPISPRAAARCGVDNEMVRGMPLIDEVIPSLREFLADARIVGYNLPAELRFLYVYGIDPPAEPRMRYDLLRLARSTLTAPDVMLPSGHARGYDVQEYSLPALCEHYGIYYENRYRPAADCLSIGLLFAALVRNRTEQEPQG